MATDEIPQLTTALLLELRDAPKFVPNETRVRVRDGIVAPAVRTGIVRELRGNGCLIEHDDHTPQRPAIYGWAFRELEIEPQATYTSGAAQCARARAEASARERLAAFVASTDCVRTSYEDFDIEAADETISVSLVNLLTALDGIERLRRRRLDAASPTHPGDRTRARWLEMHFEQGWQCALNGRTREMLPYNIYNTPDGGREAQDAGFDAARAALTDGTAQARSYALRVVADEASRR